MNWVELKYHRVAGTNLSSGSIHVDLNDEKDRIVFDSFEFEAMLKLFAKTLCDNPQACAAIQRTDRPGMPNVSLDPRTVELLKNDFPAALRSFSYTMPSPSSAIKAKSRPVAPVSVGYSAVIDAFGDHVYCRMRVNGAVECPACGMWSPSRNHSFTCGKRCGLSFAGKSLPLIDPREPLFGGWFQVSVEELLKTPGFNGKFYLPLPWNEGGQWIRHEALQQKYNDWKILKETFDVQQQ